MIQLAVALPPVEADQSGPQGQQPAVWVIQAHESSAGNDQGAAQQLGSIPAVAGVKTRHGSSGGGFSLAQSLATQWPGSLSPAMPERQQQLHQDLHQQLAAPLPANPQLVLVTDLDGTLLGGTLPQRREFYGWLERRRQEVLHVFCTGRDLASIDQLLQQDEALGLRAPHLVIGDVGCTVACGTSLVPLAVAVAPIEARWQGMPDRVAPLLAGAAGVSAQPVSADRRLAYYYDPAHFDHGLIVQLEAHGVDCVLSDNRYLDVLPAGVNKGSTLQALLELLALPAELVVTAGDTLNDLAMFETGLAGVMVGNAEPALRAHLPRLPRTYLAEGHGCAGIVEGLRHFGFGRLLS